MVIMGNLPFLYLCCRLSARCSWGNGGAGECFCDVFEVLGGTDKHCNETWTGMKTSWNNLYLQMQHDRLCFHSHTYSDVILHMYGIFVQSCMKVSIYILANML